MFIGQIGSKLPAQVLNWHSYYRITWALKVALNTLVICYYLQTKQGWTILNTKRQTISYSSWGRLRLVFVRYWLTKPQLAGCLIFGRYSLKTETIFHTFMILHTENPLTCHVIAPMLNKDVTLLKLWHIWTECNTLTHLHSSLIYI